MKSKQFTSFTSINTSSVPRERLFLVVRGPAFVLREEASLHRGAVRGGRDLADWFIEALVPVRCVISGIAFVLSITAHMLNHVAVSYAVRI